MEKPIILQLRQAIDLQRDAAFRASSQISLGDLIKRLEAVKEQDATAYFDFGNCYGRRV